MYPHSFLPGYKLFIPQQQDSSADPGATLWDKSLRGPLQILSIAEAQRINGGGAQDPVNKMLKLHTPYKCIFDLGCL